MDACVKADANSEENDVDVAATYTGVTAPWSANAASLWNEVCIGNRCSPPNTVFASLGTPANGTVAYCSDCGIANPCAGAGTGAGAKRLNGVWVCN